MKRFAIALLALAVVALVQAAPPVGDVTLAWDPQQPLNAGNTFQLRGQPLLTGNLTNWPILTNVSGLSTQATVRIVPGQFFFTITVSNMWGIGVPSNVASCPPLPASPLLSIRGAQ